MMFWIVAALVLAAVLIPLIRAVAAEPERDNAVDADVAFFKAQEAEIDRMVAEGALPADEAAAARAEAARKLIARAREQEAASAPLAVRKALVPALAVVAISALSIPLYLKLGAPGMADRPFATRTDISRPEQDMLRLVSRLDAHLAEAPNDLRGLEIALPVYMRLGRFEDAVSVAERIVVQKPDSADAHANHAETQIFAGGGAVSDDARKAVAKAMALDGTLPRARFYAGLAAEQAGNGPEALTIWRALEADLKDGPEKQAVGAQIARLAKLARSQSAPSGAIPAPSKDAADAVRALPEAEQKQAIRSMVEGLETRLMANGGSPDDWQRLVRALAMLGEKARAGAALAKALSSHQADQPAVAALTTLGRDLGLEAGGAQ